MYKIGALWCCSSDHTSVSDVTASISPHSFTFLPLCNRLVIHHYKNTLLSLVCIYQTVNEVETKSVFADAINIILKMT